MLSAMAENEERKRPPVLAHLRFQKEADRLRGLDLERLFTEIYRTNLWGGDESRSGLGSALAETARLREAIPGLLRRVGATSLLDIPCGDFGWMSGVDLGDVDYTGADIVEEIVARNDERFAGERRRFVRLDLVRDPLPRADVVLCRDCLVHLSFEKIFRALDNVARSGATYLLATTFLEHETNEDAEDGDWRMLNLERPPFSLPAPVAVIVEGCAEGGGAYADKALALWPVGDGFTRMNRIEAG